MEIRGKTGIVIEGRDLTERIHIVQSKGIVVRNNRIHHISDKACISIDSSSQIEIYDNDCGPALLDQPFWGQLTGIEVDNDVENGAYSNEVRILRNRIRDLRVSQTFLMAHGYQTDGITIAKPLSRGHEILDNLIYGVGEGIDIFGTRCVISGNQIEDAYIFGIKLIHGASHNRITNNAMRKVGLAGVTIEGSNEGGQDLVGNETSGCSVVEVNHLGAFSESSNAAFRTLGRGMRYQPRDNIFFECTVDASARYDILADSDGSGNVFRTIRGARLDAIHNAESAQID